MNTERWKPMEQALARELLGLPDIVQHQRTGYLAKAFETEDLAAGIRWVLGENLRKQSREQAVTRFSNTVVAEQYRAVHSSLTKTNLN